MPDRREEEIAGFNALQERIGVRFRRLELLRLSQADRVVLDLHDLRESEAQRLRLL